MLAAARQACAFGCRPVEMTYDGDVLHVAPIALAAPLHFVLVDLRAAKDTVIILSRLQARILRTASHTRSVLLHPAGGPGHQCHCTAPAGAGPCAGRLLPCSRQLFGALAAHGQS